MTTTVLGPTPPPPAERLAVMSAGARVSAYQDGELTLAELHVWAALYPEEVPLVNGELPWIVATLE